MFKFKETFIIKIIMKTPARMNEMFATIFGNVLITVIMERIASEIRKPLPSTGLLPFLLS